MFVSMCFISWGTVFVNQEWTEGGHAGNIGVSMQRGGKIQLRK